MSDRNNSLDPQHPLMRSTSMALEALVEAARLPIRRFETARLPERQCSLYLEGRVAGHGVAGKPTTYSKPWRSRHQFGLAEDWVFFINGQWTWVEPEPGAWGHFHDLARQVDLEPLGFEVPHVQLAHLNTGDLVAGILPAGGDAAWRDWIRMAAKAWGLGDRVVGGIAMPGCPSSLFDASPAPAQRPPIELPPGAYYDEERGMCLTAGVT